jgi:hypothetical protein
MAMQIARSIGPDWTNWTRDPNAIEAARLKLGETIDQIKNSGATAPNSKSNSAGN